MFPSSSTWKSMIVGVLLMTYWDILRLDLICCRFFGDWCWPLARALFHRFGKGRSFQPFVLKSCCCALEVGKMGGSPTRHHGSHQEGSWKSESVSGPQLRESFGSYVKTIEKLRSSRLFKIAEHITVTFVRPNLFCRTLHGFWPKLQANSRIIVLLSGWLWNSDEAYRIMYQTISSISMTLLLVSLPLGETLNVRGSKMLLNQQTCSILDNHEVYSSLRVAIGNPPQTFDLVADTGSDNCIVYDCSCTECPKTWGSCFTGPDHSNSFKLPMFKVRTGPNLQL